MGGYEVDLLSKVTQSWVAYTAARLKQTPQQVHTWQSILDRNMRQKLFMMREVFASWAGPREVQLTSMAGEQVIVPFRRSDSIWDLKMELGRIIDKPAHWLSIIDQTTVLADEVLVWRCDQELSYIAMNTGCGRGCKPDWDVRVRCEPSCRRKNSLQEFMSCPCRDLTLVAWFENDQDVMYFLDSAAAEDMTSRELMQTAAKMLDDDIDLDRDEAWELYKLWRLERFNEKDVHDDEAVPEPVADLASAAAAAPTFDTGLAKTVFKAWSHVAFLSKVSDQFGSWAVSQEPLYLPGRRTMDEFYAAGVMQLFVTNGVKTVTTVAMKKTPIIEIMRHAAVKYNQPLNTIRLAYRSKQLDADMTCAHYGIMDKDTLLLVLPGLLGGGKRARTAGPAARLSRDDRVTEAETNLGLSLLQLQGLANNPMAASVIPIVAQFKQDIDRVLVDRIAEMPKEEVKKLVVSLNASNDEKSRIAPLMRKLFEDQFLLMKNYDTTKLIIEDVLYKSVYLAMTKKFVGQDGFMNFKGENGYESLLLDTIEGGM
jgi:hypothetical protein